MRAARTIRRLLMKQPETTAVQPVRLVPPSLAIREKQTLPVGFYQVLEAPVLLAGCAFPFRYPHWDDLHGLGFRHVVCLAAERPTYSCSPLRLSIACELDDLSVMPEPLNEASERRVIGEIGRRIAAWLMAGEGVLVHCAAGRGRTGTVIGSTLRYLGVPTEEIVEYLNELHGLRSGRGWPEAEWQATILAGHDLGRHPRLDSQALEVVIRDSNYRDG